METGDIRGVIDPWTGREFAKVCFADRPMVEHALASVSRIPHAPAYERADALMMISAGIRRGKEEFTRTIVSEAGKPWKAASAEVERAAITFLHAAGEATRLGGEVIPLDIGVRGMGRFGLYRRFPVGLVAGITPFNFPLNLVAHKVAPAVASGCPLILKPASKTPVSALLLAGLIADSGLPDGAVNVLPCASGDASPLIEDERVRMLTFTGSAEVGWDLRSRAGKKKVTLELGGNAGVIVHDDADVVLAAGRCCAGAFGYSGQVCISVQRVFVQEKVYQEFLEELVRGAEALRVGDPHDPDTDVGPMIDMENALRIERWVDEARERGAEILTGGVRSGQIYPPTVLTGVPHDIPLYSREAFGPVVVVEPYERFEDALHAVNDSIYGLQAGVFTRDISRVMQAFEVLEVGGVVLNDAPTFRMDNMPYGGVKSSGSGREGVRFAVEEMTEMRMLVISP